MVRNHQVFDLTPKFICERLPAFLYYYSFSKTPLKKSSFINKTPLKKSSIALKTPLKKSRSGMYEAAMELT